jgi:2-desacetyl-2-hydroxyethyl bacteriochlorophyllide A dehydrogenase
MHKVILDAPGHFRLSANETPTPGDDEALVRVHRVGICGTDLHAFRGRQPFFTYPRVLGHELAVEVLELGGHVRTDLTPGDLCSVEPYLNCGRCIACRRGRSNCCTQLKVLGVHSDGGMRSHLVVPAHKLHRSRRLTVDQLALVETLAIGAHAVERAKIEANELVLVIGAGPIGLATVQAAQAEGARVVVLDLSESRLNFCRDQFNVFATLPAAEGEVDRRLRELGGGDLPTAVFDASGHAGSMQQAFSFVAPGGRLVFVGLVQGDLTFNDPEFHRRELTLLASRNALPATFSNLIDAIETGRVDTTPWITHRLRLPEVPDRFAAIAADPTLIKAMVQVDES